MRNQYLETLGLNIGASKSEIKSAYRKLSKKYHPDVSTDENANEKFIEINEAYKFLTDVGPKPYSSTTTAYNYNPADEIYRQRRAQAKKYARWKANEAQKRQTELVKILLSFFNTAALFILLFNVVLVVDYFIPKQATSHKSFTIHPVMEKNIHRYNDVIFIDHIFRLDAGNAKELARFDKAVVKATTILDIPVSFELTQNEVVKSFSPLYSVYAVFGYIIPVVLLFILLYRVVFKSLDNQLTVAIFLVFLAVFQAYIYLKF